MSILNQYSYLFISLAVMTVAFGVLRFLIRPRASVIIGVQVGLAGLLIAGLLILGPGTSDVSSVEQAQSLLSNGRPTFMEFFSNFCAGCLAAKPAVDRLVETIGDDYNVLRVDIHTELGRDLREQLGFSFSPEFILFDETGQEVWRDHAPPAAERLESLLNASR